MVGRHMVRQLVKQLLKLKVQQPMMGITVGGGRFQALVKAVLLQNKNLVLALVGFDQVLERTFMMG